MSTPLGQCSYIMSLKGDLLDMSQNNLHSEVLAESKSHVSVWEISKDIPIPHI